MTEAELQIQIVSWAKSTFRNILINAVPALNYQAKGTYQKEVRKGYAPGFPDLQILNPCGGHPGLLLELKTPQAVGLLVKKDGKEFRAGKATNHFINQLHYHERLKDLGYLVFVVCALEEAQGIISSYLSHNTVTATFYAKTQEFINPAWEHYLKTDVIGKQLAQ